MLPVLFATAGRAMVTRFTSLPAAVLPCCRAAVLLCSPVVLASPHHLPVAAVRLGWLDA